MECNKEEAMRAKNIGETKMQNNDFSGAQRILLKAQRLFPSLENVFQMLVVCNVHCASENKFIGTEMDWYGILQVEQTADESLIKKQYKKLAFQLHPDKNEFAGAEAAFKLIGEAQRVLLDRAKRSLHDMKRRAFTAMGRPSQTPQGSCNVGMKPKTEEAQRVIPKKKEFSHQSSCEVGMKSTAENTSSSVKNQEKTSAECGEHSTKGASAEKRPLKEINGTKKVKKQKIFCVFNEHLTSSSIPEAPKVSETIVCPPDPDFSNFDNTRKEDCFKTGQMWAIYDTVDSMPRFYARIQKVLSPGFKVRITWLEADPDDEDQIKWAKDNLPVSCGKFKSVYSQISEDLHSFSHVVKVGKGKSKRSYMIHPRKGETWAIFKNWDIKWIGNLGKNRKFEFEFVEILSDHDEETGIFVAYLGKVKNFVSLFRRIDKGGVELFQIPHNELFRFSHRVPSFQMTGKEREDVPKGSFELDPASLPIDIDTFAPEDCKMDAGEAHFNGFTVISSEDESEPMIIDSDNKVKMSSNHVNDNAPHPDTIDHPDPEFYDFAADKSIEKLEAGQIWALYNDYDGMPNWFGKIKKIHPKLKIDVTWLIPCTKPDNMLMYVDKKMPVSCGRFKLSTGRLHTYYDTAAFSHQLKVDNADKKNEFVIHPKKGEVWALYKNWNIDMKSSGLEECDYDIVEVVGNCDLSLKVLILELVNGFRTVFKCHKRGGLDVYVDVPRTELLRFSHQIPAFQLKEEREGSLRGFWELDPASLPVLCFCMN